MISKDLHSAISSPDAGAGQSHLENQELMIVDLFGQAHAPASRSVMPEVKKGKKMKDTSGLYGSSSSASAALQSSLENRLTKQFSTVGWMKLLPTWKVKTTPSRRRYYHLTALRATMNASGAITLAGTGNDFGTVTVTNATGVSLADKNVLTLNGINASGNERLIERV